MSGFDVLHLEPMPCPLASRFPGGVVAPEVVHDVGEPRTQEAQVEDVVPHPVGPESVHVSLRVHSLGADGVSPADVVRHNPCLRGSGSLGESCRVGPMYPCLW